jgi:hypothetical protein
MGLLVILSLLSLALIPCALPVHAGDESMWAGNATQPVPEGTMVTLEFDRPDYFLGENVLVHFVLQNTGDTPFEASWGGDYRGASRHLRFKVTAGRHGWPKDAQAGREVYQVVTANALLRHRQTGCLHYPGQP